MMICLKSELSGIDIFIVRHDDPASEAKRLKSWWVKIEYYNDSFETS